jgi:hypothetical protein
VRRSFRRSRIAAATDRGDLGRRGPAPATVAQVFVVEADDAGQSALATSARNVELDPSLRVSALRRLEELVAEETVQVAASLARESQGLVRDNAVATLVRLNATAEVAALASDSRTLARALAERGR